MREGFDAELTWITNDGKETTDRLDLYEEETRPLIDFYRRRSILVTVDGLGTVEEVQARLLEAIDSRFDPVTVDAR